MKAIKQNWQMIVVCVAMLATALLIVSAPSLFAKITTEAPTEQNLFRSYDFFASSTNQTTYATTSTAVSTSINSWTDAQGRIVNGAFEIAGAKRVAFYFGRGDTVGTGNSGSSAFKIEVTRDGTNWHTYNTLVQNLATSTAAVTVPATITLTGTSTAIVYMQHLGFKAVRCVVTETTDGEHSCAASADF